MGMVDEEGDVDDGEFLVVDADNENELVEQENMENGAVEYVAEGECWMGSETWKGTVGHNCDM
jgi:hypothetical protein